MIEGLPLEFKHLLNGEVVGYEIHELGFHDGTIKHYKTWYFEPGQKDGEWRKNPLFMSNEKRQYTGFKDKNGGKIYFGDKLKDGNGPWNKLKVEMSEDSEIVAANKMFSCYPKDFKEMELTDG